MYVLNKCIKIVVVSQLSRADYPVVLIDLMRYSFYIVCADILRFIRTC